MDFFKINDRSDLEKERIEQVQLKKHEYHYIGSQRKVQGHTLFSYNTKTHEIKIAEIRKCKVYDIMKQGKAFNDQLTKEKDCIYLYALNKKNFIKKLKNLHYDV